ncbi:MAG: GumC family protein [Candidatus Hydrogenedentes bacterium]|nr:GumC family protein [Candidatus Hydrogenedentota bacterium]
MFRHKVKILFVFALVYAGVVLVTFLSQEIYRSEAQLLVRLGRENLSVDPSVSGPTLYPSRDRENEVNSELAILKSRAIAEEVVQKIGVDALLEKPDESSEVQPPVPAMKDAQQELRALRREVREKEAGGAGLLVALDLATPLTPQEKAVKTVMENTTVVAESKTDILSVKYDAPSPALAQRALDAMLQSFQEHHIRVHATQASPDFFEEQTRQYQSELESSQQKLAAFREEHGITSLEQQKIVLLQQVSALETQLADTKAELSASEKRVASMRKTLSGREKVTELSRTTGRTNYAADALKEKLLELKLQETDLASRYPETHRPLIDIRKQVKEAQAALAREMETHTEVTTGIDTSFQELQLTLENEDAQLASHEGRAKVLEDELARQKSSLADLAAQEVTLKTLEREVELAEKDYKEYRESLQRARISSAMDRDNVSNVSVVQPATLPMGPVKPNKILNLALGLFLAMFAALSVAMTFEYFDDSVNSPEQVEKWVGVPVLVTVSDREYKACI